jgi:hypothetical protein
MKPGGTIQTKPAIIDLFFTMAKHGKTTQTSQQLASPIQGACVGIRRFVA